MKRRIIVFPCSVLGVTAGILLAVTVLSTYYYKNVFTFGTWINGNYCTGMTAQEVSDLLLEQYTYPSIQVKLIDDECHTLVLQEYGVFADYSENIKELLAKNTGWSWLSRGNIFKSYDISPCFEYDLTTMQKVLLEQEWMNSNLYNAQNTVSIVKTLEDGYILVDETKNLLNQEKAIQIITDSIVNELTEIDLRKECYIDIPYDQNMLKTIKNGKVLSHFKIFA